MHLTVVVQLTVQSVPGLPAQSVPQP